MDRAGSRSDLFWWLKVTGIGIPCIFRKITGWYCPGCGITTLILCISEQDFVGAFRANPFLFVTSPFLLGELAAEWIRVKRGKKMPGWNEKLLVVYTIFFVCIWNLEKCSIDSVLWWQRKRIDGSF